MPCKIGLMERLLNVDKEYLRLYLSYTPRRAGKKTMFKNNFDKIREEGHDFLYRNGVLYVWYKEKI